MITDFLEYISFQGDELPLVWKDEEAYVAVRPICDRLGLDWKSQHRKLTDPNAGVNCGHMTTVGADSKDREMVCLHVVELPLWLASISPAKVKPEVRDALIAYRRECALVLFQHVKTRLVGERDEARAWVSGYKAEWLAQKRIRSKVLALVQDGLSFAGIWAACHTPRHVVADTLRALQAMGFIADLPHGTHWDQSRQMDMFARG